MYCIQKTPNKKPATQAQLIKQIIHHFPVTCSGGERKTIDTSRARVQVHDEPASLSCTHNATACTTLPSARLSSFMHANLFCSIQACILIWRGARDEYLLYTHKIYFAQVRYQPPPLNKFFEIYYVAYENAVTSFRPTSMPPRTVIQIQHQPNTQT